MLENFNDIYSGNTYGMSKRELKSKVKRQAVRISFLEGQVRDMSTQMLSMAGQRSLDDANQQRMVEALRECEKLRKDYNELLDKYTLQTSILRTLAGIIEQPKGGKTE